MRALYIGHIGLTEQALDLVRRFMRSLRLDLISLGCAGTKRVELCVLDVEQLGVALLAPSSPSHAGDMPPPPRWAPALTLLSTHIPPTD